MLNDKSLRFKLERDLFRARVFSVLKEFIDEMGIVGIHIR
ncbi:MAG: hypothetical protein JW395_0063 [Nitrospira sp.]|nr:hypothetical protein [Nitrospira sp.]